MVWSVGVTATAQTVYTVPDARGKDGCKACDELMRNKPAEVLFGIDISEGEVYFSISDKVWFQKIFSSPRDGVAIDIITKDRYKCGKDLPEKTLPVGRFLKPLYLAELKAGLQEFDGHIRVKMGNLPKELLQKEIEGNLAIIKNGQICDYQTFVNIDRSLWDLLPMGLFADTLMQEQTALSDTVVHRLFFTRQMQMVIPFAKSKAVFHEADIKALRDTLAKHNLYVRQMDIRAYSSVEGSVTANELLQRKRAAAVVAGLQKYQHAPIQHTITSFENWVEFYKDVEDTDFDELGYLTKAEVKQKLKNATLLGKIEPLLQKERKAVVTVYLDNNSGVETVPDTALYTRFNQAVKEKRIGQASLLQKEVFSRIAAGHLPEEYMSKLEIPREKDNTILLVNEQTYLYELGFINATAAIKEYQELLKLAPDNGKIRYNICALLLTVWRYNASDIKVDEVKTAIWSLSRYGIDTLLVKRLQVNYHILLSEYHMKQLEYDKKDSAVAFVADNYPGLTLTDRELLSLAKYLCSYGWFTKSEELLEPRVTEINVEEDLLFYYLNLQLFHPASYEEDSFESIVLNAVTLNKKRFCGFFHSINNGGASFQLLEDEILRDMYCEYCKP
ncbi:hypothetical protein FLA_3341 [Filimonas lacunae]|nr:hypothetical protein FLA_3341 [Filimonas lacunae]